MKKYVLVLICSLNIGLNVKAQIELSPVFTDNMVLQKNAPIPVWGFSSPNEIIDVKFNNQSKSVVSDENGNWMVLLNPVSTNGPFELVVKGKTTVEIANITAGIKNSNSAIYNTPYDFFNENSLELMSKGPTYKSFEKIGNTIVVLFENTGSGLFTSDKYGYVKGFEIAGKDQIFYPAKAFIKGNTVVVSSDQVSQPETVQFNWIGDNSKSNLYNKEGFPALPFRTAAINSN